MVKVTYWQIVEIPDGHFEFSESGELLNPDYIEDMLGYYLSDEWDGEELDHLLDSGWDINE